MDTVPLLFMEIISCIMGDILDPLPMSLVSRLRPFYNLVSASLSN